MDPSVLFHNLSTLQIPRKDVAFAFLIGSCLWGTHNSKSDIDFIVVSHKNPTASSMHTQQCDFTLLSKSQFLDRVGEGSFLETLGLVMPPANCYIDPSFESTLNKLKQSINLKTVRSWISERSKKDFEKASKFAEKGKYHSALKVYCHTLRMRWLVQKMEELCDGGHGVCDLWLVEFTSPSDVFLHTIVTTQEEWVQTTAAMDGEVGALLV
ncbi:hypothetical protein BDR26DRAFT_860057 [Obelidium mucronatum]|nr:hypothetical protein BDR26DRAFT_860057 [Obelidium mucronatum]